MDTAANLDLVGILVPIVALLCIAVVPGLYFYFRYRTRRELQNTLRAAIERGLELTPQLLEQLGEPAQRKDADLRRGVLAIAVGVGLAAFGLLQEDPEVFSRLRAGGALFFHHWSCPRWALAIQQWPPAMRNSSPERFLPMTMAHTGSWCSGIKAGCVDGYGNLLATQRRLMIWLRTLSFGHGRSCIPSPGAVSLPRGL